MTTSDNHTGKSHVHPTSDKHNYTGNELRHNNHTSDTSRQLIIHANNF